MTIAPLCFILTMLGRYLLRAGRLVLVLLMLTPCVAAAYQQLHGEVRRGELVPLEQVLDWVEAHYLGEVLEVELERDDGEVHYEVKMIGPQGQIVEFTFDALDGRLMAMEGVNINAMMRR